MNPYSAIATLGVLASVTILGVFGVLNGEAITGLLSAIVGGGLVHAARPGAPSDGLSTLNERSSRPPTTETN